MEIKKGDRVNLKPEFMDAGDENIVFVAVEDSDGDRVKVEASNVDLKIKPTCIIKLNMIKSIGSIESKRKMEYVETTQTLNIDDETKDLLHLKNGMILVISNDSICCYSDRDYQLGLEPLWQKELHFDY